MSLENLVLTNQLLKQAVPRSEYEKLLAAAERNLGDAHVKEISVENRFDAAYKAILQCAMAALWQHGYRTSTSQPGHHQLAIQTLRKTLAVDLDTVIVLDGLRKKRNLSDYNGDAITEKELAACMEQARALLALAKQRLLS